MRLLLFNPNRSAHITARLEASARGALQDGESLVARSGRFGPEVVRDAATLAAAEAGARRELPVLAVADDVLADAVLLAISLDGAAGNLRLQLAPRPLLGMTEAAVAVAAQCGRRVGLLTLGPGLLPLYRERLADLLPAARVAGLEAPELPQAFDPGATGVAADVLPVLVDAARRLVERGADSVVLAGAVLCGYERALAAAIDRPVLDGVACAVHHLRALHRLRACRAPPASARD
jgi:allantoin racemase